MIYEVGACAVAIMFVGWTQMGENVEWALAIRLMLTLAVVFLVAFGVGHG